MKTLSKTPYSLELRACSSTARGARGAHVPPGVLSACPARLMAYGEAAGGGRGWKSVTKQMKKESVELWPHQSK